MGRVIWCPNCGTVPDHAQVACQTCGRLMWECQATTQSYGPDEVLYYCPDHAPAGGSSSGGVWAL